MSFWVHAYCNESVATVTPAELTEGIAERLALLTYLFCPDEEEAPDDVLSRLRIEDDSADGTFRAFLMYYRTDSPVFIRIDRTDGRGGVEELSEVLLSREDIPELEEIRKVLAGTKE